MCQWYPKPALAWSIPSSHVQQGKAGQCSCNLFSPAQIVTGQSLQCDLCFHVHAIFAANATPRHHQRQHCNGQAIIPASQQLQLRARPDTAAAKHVEYRLVELEWLRQVQSYDSRGCRSLQIGLQQHVCLGQTHI